MTTSTGVAVRLCSFAECGKKHNARGLCRGHCKQQEDGKQLNPLRVAHPRGRDLTARFQQYLSPVVTPAGCREWTGARNEKGYGYLWDPETRRSERAHRVAVRLDGRTIPAGMQVDHLCHNSSCCNPQHLEVVTPEENARRAAAYREERIAQSITTRKAPTHVQ